MGAQEWLAEAALWLFGLVGAFIVILSSIVLLAKIIGQL